MTIEATELKGRFAGTLAFRQTRWIAQLQCAQQYSGLRAITHRQFLENGTHVGFNGALLNVEFIGDLFIQPPIRNPHQHLELLRAQAYPSARPHLPRRFAIC